MIPSTPAVIQVGVEFGARPPSIDFKMAVAIHVKEKVSFHRDVYTSIIKGLLQQRADGEFCDVTLRVNGCKFFAHKAVLAASSPYFRSMFTSRMREESSPEVDLTQSLLIENHDSFRYILDFIYCGDMEITTSNAEDILRIADFLLLDDVKDYCRQFYLQYGNLDLHNCICVAVLAEHHNLPQVAQVARGMIKARFHDYLIFSEEILDVPEGCLLIMLRDAETVQFTSTDNLVQGILRWVRHDEINHQGALLRLLSCTQIQSLSNDTVQELLDETIVRSNSEMVAWLETVKSADGNTASGKSTHKVLLPRSVPTNVSDSGIPCYSEDEQNSIPVLVAANCSPAFRFLKILVYNTAEQMWFNLPINGDAVLHAVPPRLCVCNMTLHNQTLYLLLCYSLPYPSDLARIHVMAIDIVSGQHQVYVFRHFTNQSLCCQTTLTDDRAVPPVILCCRGYLVIVANREGSGNLFLCDLDTQTYLCYQVPGVRFISLARCVVKADRYVYLWCRHRFGHEEYCINKEVTFLRYDCKYKTFNMMEIPPPPSISYGEFGDPHVMALEGNSVIIHTPGKLSLVLDELRNEWLTFHRRLPPYPQQKSPLEVPYHGYEVYVSSGSDVYVLQNPAAYTTCMCCLQDLQTGGVYHPPPPVDCVSLLTSGHLPAQVLSTLVPCDMFDDTYTRLVHNRAGSLDYDTEESGTPRTPNSDSEDEYEFDGYEYDDDIYGYYDDGEW